MCVRVYVEKHLKPEKRQASAPAYAQLMAAKRGTTIEFILFFPKRIRANDKNKCRQQWLEAEVTRPEWMPVDIFGIHTHTHHVRAVKMNEILSCI